MFTMKYYGVYTFALVVTLCFVTSQAVNSTYGLVGPYDRLLHREYVVIKPQFLRVVSKDVVYPPKGYINRNRISAVRALDQSRGKTGGFATLYNGGPGFFNVTLQLKSFRGQALNFTVEVYGR